MSIFRMFDNARPYFEERRATISVVQKVNNNREKAGNLRNGTVTRQAVLSQRAHHGDSRPGRKSKFVSRFGIGVAAPGDHHWIARSSFRTLRDRGGSATDPDDRSVDNDEFGVNRTYGLKARAQLRYLSRNLLHSPSSLSLAIALLNALTVSFETLFFEKIT